MSSAILGFQVAMSAFRAARAITGLQVAPTAPWEIESFSSAIEAESFHRQVGVVCVIWCSGLLEAVGTAVMVRATYQGGGPETTAFLKEAGTEMDFYRRAHSQVRQIPRGAARRS